jgi:hypothetical protein
MRAGLTLAAAFCLALCLTGCGGNLIDDLPKDAPNTIKPPAMPGMDTMQGQMEGKKPPQQANAGTGARPAGVPGMPGMPGMPGAPGRR